MKTSHIIFFIVLYLIYRQQQNRIIAAQPTAPAATNGFNAFAPVNDTMLRRDMQERFDLLEAEIQALKNSPYA